MKLAMTCWARAEFLVPSCLVLPLPEHLAAAAEGGAVEDGGQGAIGQQPAGAPANAVPPPPTAAPSS